MEEDIDIYSDLTSFNLKLNEEKIQCRNCEELKKDINSLTIKYENIKKINGNLENNLSSLLKTAKAEIARKDKMIDNLRKQLDNVAFRRNNGALNSAVHKSSHQCHNIVEKHEDVTSSMPSEENEYTSYQIELHYDECKSKKQNDVDQIPITVFGERLRKRIMEDEKEEKRQKALSKPDAETNIQDVLEECIVESDKENGTQSSINNHNTNESNTSMRNSSLGTLYKKNLGKRLHNKDSSRNKRLKSEDNENEIAMVDEIGAIDGNCIAQYDIKDNLTYCEVKDNFAKFEDCLGLAQHAEKEQISFDAQCKTRTEYKDTKRSENYTNGWKRKEGIDSGRNYDSHIKKESVDNLSNFRNTSISKERSSFNDRQQNYYSNSYRKNDRKCSSPSFRSHSKSRNDYESSSSHQLRGKWDRTYRDKYDDYKYDDRRNNRSKRSYDSKEVDNSRIRYSSRERGDLRNRLRHSSCDIEDRQGRTNSFRNNKYYRTREVVTITSDNKRLHENDKINKTVKEIDFRTSSRIVNTTVDQNVKQRSATVEPCINVNSIDDQVSSTNTGKDQSNLEDGEILDFSPEKKDNSAKISKDEETCKYIVKIIPFEDRNENLPVNAFRNDVSSSLQNSIVKTEKLGEIADISVQKDEVESSLLQTNSKDADYKKITQLNAISEDIAIKNVMYEWNSDVCKFRSGENLMDFTVQNVITIEQKHENNIDNENCKNCTDEKSEECIQIVKIEKDDLNDKSVAKNEKINNSNTESIVQTKEANNSDNDDGKTSFIVENPIKEIVSNCNQDSADKDHASIKNEISHQISSKSNTEVSHSSIINDHNYIRDICISTSVNVSDHDTAQKSPVVSECCITTQETTSSEIKTEETVSLQSISIKKTINVIKNKKEQEQESKMVISRRRKAVTLSDNNASMTVLMNTNTAKTSSTLNNNNDSMLKPRACKLARICKTNI